MAFEKRTWLARLGLGLNKFIIGEKDAQGKQELTNSPDSVAQQGDVISADNLNDLEDRIQAGINGLMLTKVWENSSPDSSFAGQNVVINSKIEDMVIEFVREGGYKQTVFFHCTCRETPSNDTILAVTTFWVGDSIFSLFSRRFTYSVSTSSTTLAFNDCKQVIANGQVPTWTYNTTNSILIPYRVYAVGDIYK